MELLELDKQKDTKSLAVAKKLSTFGVTLIDTGCTENPPLHNRTLTFPLATSDDIECLERCVQQSDSIRRQYEKILQFNLNKTPLKPAFALLKIFTEEALSEYNYSGHCNYTRDKKKAMRNYCIFTTCIDAAWSNTLSTELRTRAIRDVVALIGNRKRMRRLKERKAAPQ
ncbi:uncharacterized protein LOC128720986 [Anopheles nili]|uniref:uncharacterized protein LOC128720986 n=1 Tax=Anopheles nili TaxID=185578 RepID=UPI00237BE138|nr:uncharacterized protein LOC128720986 [Anopheles nili]